jgi:CDP-glucose 4,6-dehydratase
LSDQRCRGEAFNFSTETPVTVLDVVQMVLRLMGSDLKPIIQDEARHEIRAQYLSVAKAREFLAWQPRFTLVEGLTRTIEWYEKSLAVAR